MVASGPVRRWTLVNGSRVAEIRSGMASVKEDMIRLIQEQPDDSSFEEILRELAFSRMVDRGLSDSEAGRVISHEEMSRRIETWPK
jgi:hypothetical protein